MTIFELTQFHFVILGGVGQFRGGEKGRAFKAKFIAPNVWPVTPFVWIREGCL